MACLELSKHAVAFVWALSLDEDWVSEPPSSAHMQTLKVFRLAAQDAGHFGRAQLDSGTAGSSEVVQCRGSCLA